MVDETVILGIPSLSLGGALHHRPISAGVRFEKTYCLCFGRHYFTG
jgi:hypothetical protein